MRPHIPPERGHGTREGRFDYSETRLSANGTGKTTPKLVSLPKRPWNRPTPHRAPSDKAGARTRRPASKAAVGTDATIKHSRPHQTRSLPTPPQWENTKPPTCSSSSGACSAPHLIVGCGALLVGAGAEDRTPFLLRPPALLARPPYSPASSIRPCR